MTSIGFTTVGSGPVKVIAAHSWLVDHQTFAPMFPYLDGDAYTFVFPDYRGYGKSKAIAGEFTAREMGRDLVVVADALGWDRFHLVGHSMSGQAAQWIAGSAEYGKSDPVPDAAVPGARQRLSPRRAGCRFLRRRRR